MKDLMGKKELTETIRQNLTNSYFMMLTGEYDMAVGLNQMHLLMLDEAEEYHIALELELKDRIVPLSQWMLRGAEALKQQGRVGSLGVSISEEWWEDDVCMLKLSGFSSSIEEHWDDIMEISEPEFLWDQPFELHGLDGLRELFVKYDALEIAPQEELLGNHYASQIIKIQFHRLVDQARELLIRQDASWKDMGVLSWVGSSPDLCVTSPAKSDKEDEEDDQTMASLVCLLKEPRKLLIDELRSKAAKIFETSFETGNEDASHFIVKASAPELEEVPKGSVETVLLSAEEGLYIINSFSIPYMDFPEDPKDSVVDIRMQNIITKHNAWFSVDTLDIMDAEDRAEAYANIGKMVAELAGPDCLGIYCPESRQLQEYDEKLLEQLNGGEPLAVFGEPTSDHVIGVDADDPRMVAAVAEAKERWPEFVAALSKDADKDLPYIVKAEFSEGDHSEYMWMEVDEVDGDVVRGVLSNQPVDFSDLKMGQRVDVDVSAVNDWLYVQNDEIVGGFTMNVIGDIAEETYARISDVDLETDDGQ